MDILQKFKRWLSEPTDGHVLGLFRLLFGALMAYNIVGYWRRGWIENGILAPKVLFKYEGLEWLHPLSQPAMLAVLGLAGLAALLIAAGVLFRWACWAFALGLSFVFLQEKSYFNNHIYLFILLAVLLSCTYADRFLSLHRKSARLAAVPRWQQFILQAQIVIVYFFGGITKMKADWLLRKEPATSMVHFFPDTHWLAPLFKTDFTASLLTYGGFLLDILAPLLLWHKGLRRWALAPFVLFHLANSRIFNDIGIFPYVMLVTLILFFETKELPLLRDLAAPRQPAAKKHKQPPAEPAAAPPTPVWLRNALVGYFALQLLLPFRGFFLPNPIDWTSIARNFAWRMKADTRAVEEMAFTLQNPVNGQLHPVDIRSFVNEMQVTNMASDPRSVAAFARMLREEAAKHGMPGALVKASIKVRYNGRPPQLFVNPNVDLASVTCSPFKKLDWVMPLNE